MNMQLILGLKLLAEKLVVTYNESIVNFHPQLEIYSNDSYSFGFNATLLQKLDNFYIQVLINFADVNGNYEPFLRKVVSDMCHFYKNQRGNKILRNFYNSNYAERKFPETCPILPVFLQLHEALKLVISYQNNESKFEQIKILS
ncbi:CLUMA_CG001220, isoform A [Clunio marinus]|uniref:CLUMA_CG001220, isoform A n=1 Tax=Clunio marinus TaxID=568069 RepID=A0A1J1HIN5_9DIPT|nr:CLUMA_CG001220, isoform A [Clunio marinus]